MHYPSKHETSTQCWVNVGPPSPTSPQHSPSIGSMYRVCWDGPEQRTSADCPDTGEKRTHSGYIYWKKRNKIKWNESGFRPPLCTYRLNWARRTPWGWWDDWDDTVLQTQDSKFEPWRSETEHATSRSRRLPTILTFTRGWGRNNFVSFKPPRPGTEPRTNNDGGSEHEACLPENGPASTKHCITFAQCWTNVEDARSTMYKCYT